MAKDLTADQKQEALQYLMFLKQKRCGKIKGRGCADGRPQRQYMSKEETLSPTVMTESVLLSCAIDAMEGCDVATADIPGRSCKRISRKKSTYESMERWQNCCSKLPERSMGSTSFERKGRTVWSTFC